MSMAERYKNHVHNMRALGFKPMTQAQWVRYNKKVNRK